MEAIATVPEVSEVKFPVTQNAEGMIVLTEKLKKLLLSATSVSFHFGAPEKVTSRCMLEVVITHKVRGVETKTVVEGWSGLIGSGYKDGLRTLTGGDLGPYTTHSTEPSNWYAPKGGVWTCLYAGYCEHTTSIFKALPVGSALTFEVRFDELTTSSMVQRGLHGDLLSVRATGGRGDVFFNLDQAVGLHNSARFGWDCQ